MKKQILTLMISSAILSINPVFAMDQEAEKENILIPRKIPTKFRIDFTHNIPMVGVISYFQQGLKYLTGYEDSQTKEERTQFLESQKQLNEKVELELYDASLSQLQEILPLCKNVVGLMLTNSTYRSDLWPNDSFIEAITTATTLSTLEYLCIQEHKNITVKGVFHIIKPDPNLPELRHIHCEADDYLGFYTNKYKGPEFYQYLFPLRKDLKLTYAANYELYSMEEAPQATEQNSTAVLEQLVGK